MAQYSAFWVLLALFLALSSASFVRPSSPVSSHSISDSDLQGEGRCYKTALLTCVEDGEACGCPLGNSSYCFNCKPGSSCVNGICEKLGVLGENCTFACYSPEGADIYCGDNMCIASNVFQAGEACQENSTMLENGGCSWGLSCNNGSCSEASEIGVVCDYGSECGPNGVCVLNKCEARRGAGSNCTRDSICKQTLHCINEKCVPFHSMQEGETCAGDPSCAVGLDCYSGWCVKPIGVGNECSDTIPCGNGTMCQCNYDKGTKHCVSLANTEEMVDALLGWRKCAEDNNISEDLNLFAGNQVDKYCRKEYLKLQSLSQPQVQCSSASWRSPTFWLMIAAAVLAVYF